MFGGAALAPAAAAAAGGGAFEAADTPLPPGPLRSSIAGPFGLRVNVSEADDMQVLADLSSVMGGGGGGPWRFEYAWTLPSCAVSAVSAPTEAALPTECSSKGLCDREAGACACFAGYQGAACEKSAETAIV